MQDLYILQQSTKKLLPFLWSSMLLPKTSFLKISLFIYPDQSSKITFLLHLNYGGNWTLLTKINLDGRIYQKSEISLILRNFIVMKLSVYSCISFSSSDGVFDGEDSKVLANYLQKHLFFLSFLMMFKGYTPNFNWILTF